jgi:hypothetical protein
MTRYEVQVEKPSPEHPFNIMIEIFSGTLEGLQQARDYQQKMRGRGFVVELKKTIRMD